MSAVAGPVPVAGDPGAAAAVRGARGARADGAALPPGGLRGALLPGAAEESHPAAGQRCSVWRARPGLGEAEALEREEPRSGGWRRRRRESRGGSGAEESHFHSAHTGTWLNERVWSYPGKTDSALLILRGKGIGILCGCFVTDIVKCL